MTRPSVQVRVSRSPVQAADLQTQTPPDDPLRRWIAVWWRAVRPFSFTASVTPVLVGTAVAVYEGTFWALRFAVTLIAAVAIHAATNLTNDYYDHLRGVDTVDSIGPSGVIQQGLLSAQTVWKGALALFGIGGVLGLWLVAQAGWPILVLGALSILAGYAYTGGPTALGYVGLGDLTVFLFMGPVAVVGACYVQTLRLSVAAAWASLPVAALVTAILVVNNLRDIDDDRAKGKRTLATFIGPAATRVEGAVLLGFAYASVVVGVAAQVLPPMTLLILLTVPRAWTLWGIIRRETGALPLTVQGVRGTADLHMRLGLLLALAFVLA